MAQILAGFSKTLLQRLLLVAMVSVVYGNSLGNGFVWDDKLFFIGNPVYSAFRLRDMFLSLGNGVEYLPLRDLTYAFDYLLWGEKPFGFHLTNLLIFAATVLLVHCLAEKISKKIASFSGRAASGFIPFIVAAGFAVHPINAEAVNFITCRNVLVSGFFFFAACIFFIRSLDGKGMLNKQYALALCAFIGAILGKATAIVLPLLLLVIVPMLFPQQLKRIFLLLVPFFAIAAGVFAVFKLIAEKSGVIRLHSAGLTVATIGSKLAVALQIPLFYLKKLLIPSGFSVEYVTDFGASLFSLRVALAVALLLLSVIVVVRCRDLFPELRLGACWFIVALLPVLNFFGTHPLVADRYAYLPTFGFMLVTASVMDRIKFSGGRSLVIAVVFLGMSIITVNRSLDWKSEETLWRSNIRNFPNESKSYLNLAAFYVNNHQKQQALDLLAANSTVPLLSVYLDFYTGVRLIEENDLVTAKDKIQKTVDILGSFAAGDYYLGYIAEMEGDYISAAHFYNRVVNSKDKVAGTEIALARNRLEELKKKWLDKYLAGLKQSLTNNPANLAARRDLAIALDQLGFYAEAAGEYLELENSGIKGWQIYQNIANCYFSLNQDAEASRYYEKVVQLGAANEDTFTNLGIAYKKMQRHDQAVATLEQGSRQFPDSAHLLFNLGVTYHDAARKDAARNIFLLLEKKFPDYKERVAQYLQSSE